MNEDKSNVEFPICGFDDHSVFKMTSKPITDCLTKGCRNLETRCKDCGRLVCDYNLDEVIPKSIIRLYHEAKIEENLLKDKMIPLEEPLNE